MLPQRQISYALRSSRTWMALSVLAPIGMLIVSGLMLLDLRRDAWDRSEQTTKNLLQVIERDITRNFEIIDLSLQAVVDNLREPETAQASPRARQMILFDRAATATDIGVMLVLDENGDSIFDAAAVPARKINNADREYFQAHKARHDLGLHISKPVISRLTNAPIIVISRRINKSDGSFGGIVLASLNLSYFTSLFDQIGLGRDGAINLYLRSGTRLMRYPYVQADVGVNIAGTPNFDRFVREGRGAFVGMSVRDGIERHYAFSQVGNLPLILNVAVGTAEVEAEWRVKALGIGAVVLVLCGLTIVLTLLFARELRRSAEMHAAVAHLSLTDPLTGLANRRQFENALARLSDDAKRSDKVLSLLVVDADHFKRYNDRYGHTVGDEVLKALAHCLAASVHRPGDLVCRIGGEEFVLLLPETDEPGALRIAGMVHQLVAKIAVPSAGIEPGRVTVSIGLATGIVDAQDLYQRADAALYKAKDSGRNQTICAPRGCYEPGDVSDLLEHQADERNQVQGR